MRFNFVNCLSIGKALRLFQSLIFIPLILAGCAGPNAHMTPQQEADMLYAKASQLQDEESYNEANVQFEEFVKKYPDSNSADNAKLQIANGYFQQKKYDQAVAEYQGVVNSYSESDAADHALAAIGDVYFAQQKYSEAVESYNKLLRKYPRKGIQISVNARNRINAVKDMEEDLNILKDGKEEDKDNAQYDIGDIYYAVFNNYERALEEFQKVIDRWPKSELADDTLWRMGDCYWNIASQQVPSMNFSQEHLAFIALMEIYDKYPQLTKIRLFHLDAHWPAATRNEHEYEVLFKQTRLIVNKYPGIQEKKVVDFIPENYRNAFEKWQDIIDIYSHTDKALEAPGRLAQAFVDLGNIYYNMGQKHFACLFFRESLAAMPTPAAHLGMARYYGNITSVSAPPWAYRRAFYHIKEAEQLTPPDSPMADKVSWAKEWMNYKMRIEGLENWPEKKSR